MTTTQRDIIPFDLYGERIHISQLESLPPEIEALLPPPCRNIAKEQEDMDCAECAGQSENWPLVAAIFVALAVLVGLLVKVWWQFT